MHKQKLKEIQSLIHLLSVNEDNISRSQGLTELPFTDLMMFNGSNKKQSICIPKDLKEPLLTFLLDYYATEREGLYNQLKDRLNNE